MKTGLNKFVLKTLTATVSQSRLAALVVVLCVTLFSQIGCQSPSEYRLEADKVAGEIIKQKMQAVGRTEQFSIERPSDILRRRLLTEQNLPFAGSSSLGADRLKTIEHWPEADYPKSEPLLDPIAMLEEPNKPLKLSLMQALQVGARNSFEYQTRKEDIFKEALDLDLERNEFRNIFTTQVESLIETDMRGGRTVSGVEYGGATGISRKLESGVELTTELAVSLANLLTLNKASAFGISADATVSVPLLRGSGRHIVTEPLTQAERNVVYAIYQFERFRRTFAVGIAAEYLSVLRQLDVVKNNEENYRGLIRSARRARRQADAGRLTEVQVDQAVQDELRARNRWINAAETYKRRLDSFKNLLGLPPDAGIELDRSELQRLAVYSDKFSVNTRNEQELETNVKAVPADAPVVLEPPDTENIGPLEIDETAALELAFEKRFDLMVAQGKVYDAQRAIVVLADALGAELTLFGSAELGGSRSISTAASDDTKLRTDKGVYSALLTLDLPFERTAERNAYRNGFITLEQAVRDVQILEDEIKISIRNKLRDLLESREGVQIQARSVTLAQKRVRSTNLFLEAGRAQIRDLLESQEALLSAQNALTAAIINYRVAELELQRDMGVLQINEKGLWQEYSPGEK
ncbi:MAG: TolC family protein [Sedimentisphaerales bacterium]|nr:TolC family protein [Sedimentisphaerales bacterium]